MPVKKKIDAGEPTLSRQEAETLRRKIDAARKKTLEIAGVSQENPSEENEKSRQNLKNLLNAIQIKYIYM